MTIKITVSDKRVVVDGTPVIVCGNSDYSIEFTFDEEWNAYIKKTARFRWLQNSAEKHKDVEFTGTTVDVPILFDTSFVMVGVYAGDLCTTTPAKVLCTRSILCGKSEEQISPQEKAGMQAQINDLGDRVGALEKGGTGGNTGSDSVQNGNGLTTAQVEAIYSMFKVCVCDDSLGDVVAAHAAFKAAFGITDSGDGTHTHSYTSKVTTAATCATAGVKTYTCACGDSYTESIPANGHNYVDGVCTVCGAADPDYNPDATLTSISAEYSGGDVPVGTAVTDLTGIVVTAHYDDGSTATVYGYTLSGAIAEGENTVTVSYGGMTTTFTVTGVVPNTFNDYSVLEEYYVKYNGQFTAATGWNVAYFEVKADETYTITAYSGKNCVPAVLVESGYAGETTNKIVLDYAGEAGADNGVKTTTYTVPQDGCLLVVYRSDTGITIVKNN